MKKYPAYSTESYLEKINQDLTSLGRPPKRISIIVGDYEYIWNVSGVVAKLYIPEKK